MPTQTKFKHLRDWLSLEEAATHFSSVFDQSISVTDLLMLAVEDKLTIALHVPHGWGYRASIPGAALTEAEKQEIEINGVSSELRKKHEATRAKLQFEHAPIFKKNTDGTFTVSKEKEPYIASQVGRKGNYLNVYRDEEVTYLAGYFDLPMEGAEWNLVNAIATGSLDFSGFGGLSGQLWLKDFGGNYFVLARWNQERKKYEMDDELPAEPLFVIRRSELLRYEAMSLEKDESASGVRFEAFHSNHLRALFIASREFWGNADRDDKSTYPNTSGIEDWLSKNHNFSKSLATHGAAIIRPKWAGTGRPPEK